MAFVTDLKVQLNKISWPKLAQYYENKFRNYLNFVRTYASFDIYSTVKVFVETSWIKCVPKNIKMNLE